MKIGIDLGGSHIAVGVVAEEGRLLVKQEKDIIFEEQENKKLLIRDTMVSLINNVLRNIQIPIFIVEEIGVGIPGITEKNKIIKCGKFQIEEWDLAGQLEEYYQIPVKLKNDAICAGIAEKTYGNLKEVKRGIFLCLGTGIGGATILENKILPSEYGHMVIESKGRKCHCGRKGCFGTYCSMKTFKQEIIEILNLKKETTSETLLSILKQEKNNKIVNEYIDTYIQNLLIGISNIINITNAQKICIGGSFTYFEDILYKRLLEKYININCLFEKPKIVLAKLGNDAGIIGATL